MTNPRATRAMLAVARGPVDAQSWERPTRAAVECWNRQGAIVARRRALAALEAVRINEELADMMQWAGEQLELAGEEPEDPY